ncbi:MAG TPA: NUDIX domain-containing protein [Rhodospirillales bacterium]|nr:NUDIX domain-containing protein [Rhodospirillales bacterium]
MNRDDIQVIEKTTPFQGYFRIDHYRMKHRLFEGGWSAEMSREVFERGHAVTVALYDPDLDKLVLIEQFRPGAMAAIASPWFADDASPWLIETVAGIIDQGETPEIVARREAMEEANCEIKEIIPVCQYFVSPGGSSESIFVFCGRVDASSAGGVHGLEAEHENLRVFTVSPAQTFQWLDSGKISNAMTMIALNWFRLNHQKVRDIWLDA